MSGKSPADRGKKAEQAVEKVLKAMNEQHFRFAFERLPDARAAGGRLKAAICDYLCWWRNDEVGLRYSIQLEVKETEHDYRLEKKALEQLPRLRKVANAGGDGVVLVFHSTIDRWRAMSVWYFAGDIPPSWDLRNVPTYGSANEALQSLGIFPEVEL